MASGEPAGDCGVPAKPARANRGRSGDREGHRSDGAHGQIVTADITATERPDLIGTTGDVAELLEIRQQ
jgi:hypothetical protein